MPWCLSLHRQLSSMQYSGHASKHPCMHISYSSLRNPLPVEPYSIHISIDIDSTQDKVTTDKRAQQSTMSPIYLSIKQIHTREHSSEDELPIARTQNKDSGLSHLSSQPRYRPENPCLSSRSPGSTTLRKQGLAQSVRVIIPSMESALASAHTTIER
jgi:hypothetical protein